MLGGSTPALRPARHTLDLPRGQTQHLTQLADSPACAEGGEGCHQRRVIRAVAFVHARDQHLANVAGEVQIDVGQVAQLLVQEAPEQQPVRDRVDVRKTGQVADDRGHRGAATPPRREQGARRVRPPHLDSDLARQLQHLVVEQEEARQPEPLDHPQLLLQPRAGLHFHGGPRAAVSHLPVHEPRTRPVALVKARATQLDQASHGALVLRPRVAIAEILAQVEAQLLRETQRLADRLGVVGEAVGHRPWRADRVAVVAAPERLGSIERGVVAQRHERVL